LMEISQMLYWEFSGTKVFIYQNPYMQNCTYSMQKCGGNLGEKKRIITLLLGGKKYNRRISRILGQAVRNPVLRICSLMYTNTFSSSNDSRV
jgi:hypothetical protein